MKLKRGSTSVRRLIFIADSSSTTGAGLASLTYNSSGLVAYYFAGDLSNEVAITLATATLGTYTSGGFVAVDNTNMPGWYEIGIPDAALDGGNECAIQLRGATNMVPVNVYIELDAVDYQVDALGAVKPTTPGRTLTVDTSGNVVLQDNSITAAKIATDAVAEIQSGLASQTSVDTLATYVDTEVAAIKAKTDNLPADPADASDIAASFGTVNTKLDTIDDFLDTEIAAIKAKTDNLPTDPADQSLVEAAITAATSGLASQTSVDTLATYVDTEVAAIKAKTDNLPVDPADASDIAASFSTVNTTLATIAAYIDTEIAAIKSKTDNLPADPADASDIAASFSSIASSIATLTTYVDTEVAAIKAKTDNLPSDPADQSAVEAAITAAASLLATAAELAKVPKVGQSHRFTQIANNTGAKTADVSISVIP